MSAETLTSQAGPLKEPQAEPEGRYDDGLSLHGDRRVGVELEFADLSVPVAAQLTADLFHGEMRLETRHHATVSASSLGDFDVLLDTSLSEKLDEDSQTVAKARVLFGDLAAIVIPVEIACPPVPAKRLGEIETLVDGLRSAGASGTQRSLFYAFGTHLNVEAASVEPEAVARVMRAYLLLEDWLRDQIAVDPSRSAVGFEKRFSNAYQRHVMAPDYAPDAAALISDYLRFNPSRDFGLDLLPLLASIDEPAVREALPRQKVSARPAYHYRLPNSEIDNPSWSLRQELDRWRVVERLAASRAQLAAAAEERLALLSEPLADLPGRARQSAQSTALGDAVAALVAQEDAQ
ncbi:MAG: amidoligase family protein [Pseudomonadota bacterium]